MTLNIPMIKPVLHYYDMSNEVVAFSTTRHGGVSKGKLATLNINPYRGDDPTAVTANLQAVATEIGVAADKIVRLHQIHETHCLAVTDDFSNYQTLNKQKRKREKTPLLLIVVMFVLVFTLPIVSLFSSMIPLITP